LGGYLVTTPSSIQAGDLGNLAGIGDRLLQQRLPQLFVIRGLRHGAAETIGLTCFKATGPLRTEHLYIEQHKPRRGCVEVPPAALTAFIPNGVMSLVGQPFGDRGQNQQLIVGHKDDCLHGLAVHQVGIWGCRQPNVHKGAYPNLARHINISKVAFNNVLADSHP